MHKMHALYAIPEKFNAIFICVRHSFSAPKNDNYLNDYLWSFLCNECIKRTCINCTHADTHIVCHPNNKRHKKSHWKSVKNSTFCHRYSIWWYLCVLYMFHFFFFLCLSLSLFLFMFYLLLSPSLFIAPIQKRQCPDSPESAVSWRALYSFLFWIFLLLLSIKCKQYLVVWHWFQLWTHFFCLFFSLFILTRKYAWIFCMSFMLCSRKTNQAHIHDYTLTDRIFMEKNRTDV